MSRRFQRDAENSSTALPSNSRTNYLQKHSPVDHILLEKKGYESEVIISEEKWRDLKRDDETSESGGKWEMKSEVNLIKVNRRFVVECVYYYYSFIVM